MANIMRRKAEWLLFFFLVLLLRFFYNKLNAIADNAKPRETPNFNFVPFNARHNDEGARGIVKPGVEPNHPQELDIQAIVRHPPIEDMDVLPAAASKNIKTVSVMNQPPTKDMESWEADYEDEDDYEDTYDDQRDTVINPFPFKTVLAPIDPCLDPKLYIFFFIYSAPRNRESRQLIRETWGNKKLYKAKIGYLFFLGLEENSTKPADEVMLENTIHGDIIVEDYIDSYYNLSRKGMAGMRYAHQHCSHVRRIVRSDDDVLIDVFHLIRFFRSEDPSFDHGAFLCRPQPSSPLRDKGSKWYVSYEEWPQDDYPPVCNGFIYIMSPDVSGTLFDIALNTRYFKFEDVFITGLLMQKANLTKVNIGRFFDGKFPRFTRALRTTPPGQDFPYIFTLTHRNTTSEVKEVWDFIKHRYLL